MISICEGSISKRGATRSSCVATPASGCAAELDASAFGPADAENLLVADLLTCVIDLREAVIACCRRTRAPTVRANMIAGYTREVEFNLNATSQRRV